MYSLSAFCRVVHRCLICQQSKQRVNYNIHSNSSPRTLCRQLVWGANAECTTTQKMKGIILWIKWSDYSNRLQWHCNISSGQTQYRSLVDERKRVIAGITSKTGNLVTTKIQSQICLLCHRENRRRMWKLFTSYYYTFMQSKTIRQ